jgi:hypothetical protein
MGGKPSFFKQAGTGSHGGSVKVRRSLQQYGQSAMGIPGIVHDRLDDRPHTIEIL